MMGVLLAFLDGVTGNEVAVGFIVGGIMAPPTVGATIAVLKSQIRHLREDHERTRQALSEIREAQEEERVEVHERLAKLETLIIRNGHSQSGK